MQGLLWGKPELAHEYNFDVVNIRAKKYNMQQGGMQPLSLLFIGNLVDYISISIATQSLWLFDFVVYGHIIAQSLTSFGWHSLLLNSSTLVVTLHSYSFILASHSLSPRSTHFRLASAASYCCTHSLY